LRTEHRQKKRAAYRSPLQFGGDEEARTPDLRIANATLSQLSYAPLFVTVLRTLYPILSDFNVGTNLKKRGASADLALPLRSPHPETQAFQDRRPDRASVLPKQCPLVKLLTFELRTRHSPILATSPYRTAAIDQRVGTVRKGAYLILNALRGKLPERMLT
jgi:hypothetical protein